MKRPLLLPFAALFAPVIVAAVLLFTRDVEPLRRDQGDGPPPWLAGEVGGKPPCRYIGRSGLVWWRCDLSSQGGTIRIAPPLAVFPEGCEVAWFVRKGSPLLLRPAADADPIPGPDSGKVRSGRIFFHRLPPDALARGATLELKTPMRFESLFVSFFPTRMEVLEADYGRITAWGGHRGRTLFAVLTAAFLLLAVAFLVRYRATGTAEAGLVALAATFALGALWFDSPVWSSECRIDAGDDSYYLAYAQNLANHGSFFRAPTDIRFGARHVGHCHGLPGIALMLSPPLLGRALPGNSALRGTPIHPGELRAMRATSMVYALLATLLLFGTLRLRRAGTAPPSVWDVLLPALLFWGTSLPRWAFVRSIFTHPAELFLLCLALFLAAQARPRHPDLRDVALAGTVGLLVLVRGEYLPVAPLFLLLPRRPRATPCKASRHARAHAFLRRHGAPLLVLAAFVGVYAYWVSQISSGYGRPADSHLPFNRGFAAVLGEILRNAGVLLRSFMQNGAILPTAAVLAIAALFLPGLRARAMDLPTSPRATVLLAALLFLLNACFTPPLGDEFGHRYALKLYPFALLWLGTLLAGPTPETRMSRAARTALVALPVCALFANLRLLLQTTEADYGQNFSLLSNLQLRTLPPSGSGALNLRFALWILLVVWGLWLLVELLSPHRRSKVPVP